MPIYRYPYFHIEIRDAKGNEYLLNPAWSRRGWTLYRCPTILYTPAKVTVRTYMKAFAVKPTHPPFSRVSVDWGDGYRKTLKLGEKASHTYKPERTRIVVLKITLDRGGTLVESFTLHPTIPPPPKPPSPIVIICSSRGGRVTGTLDGLSILVAEGSCSKRPRKLRGERLSFPVQVNLTATPSDPNRYRFSHWEIKADGQTFTSYENPLVRSFSVRKIWIRAKYASVPPPAPPPEERITIPRPEVEVELWRRLSEIDTELRILRLRIAELERERREILRRLFRPTPIYPWWIPRYPSYWR